MSEPIESPFDKRFEVRNKEAEAALRGIGDVLKAQTPKGMGFAFFLFDFGEKGGLYYVSNAQREDMIKTMEEWIAKEKRKS